jgi:enamine deaminase RidA (YjgF/YER057c/UK114 family)
MRHKTFSPPELLPAKYFSNVLVAEPGPIVFIAGQVPADADGNIVGKDDLLEQMRQVLRNVEIALKAAGATLEDLVKITAFIVGYGGHVMDDVRNVRGEFFGDNVRPTSSVYGVTALSNPDYLIEIEAVAILPAGRSVEVVQ